MLGVGLVIGGCAKPLPPLKNPEVAAQLKSFVAEKEARANTAVKSVGNGMPSEHKSFFAASERRDWQTISNMF
jgi:hypothetical protein